MLEATLLTSPKRRSSGKTDPYRYWRMNIGASNTTGAIVLAELMFKDDQGINLCPPRKSFSAANGSYSNTYLPEKAFDGIIPKTRYEYSHWQYNGTAPYWIQIDLGVPTSLTSYVIAIPQDPADPVPFLDYSPNNWKIMASNNGTSWTEIQSQTGKIRSTWVGNVEHEFFF